MAIAATAVPEIKVMNFTSTGQMQKQMQSMARQGWSADNITVVPGHVSPVLTLLKWVTLIGIFSGTHRTSDTYIVLFKRNRT